MTQEDKQLLLKDLIGRLPYGVICTVWFKDGEGWKNEDMKLSGLFSDSSQQFFTSTNGSAYSDEFIFYLRPMSSMTEEEVKEIQKINWQFCKPNNVLLECFVGNADDGYCSVSQMSDILEYLNAHHFDYRGLIEKGLALKAPEGMYES